MRREDYEEDVGEAHAEMHRMIDRLTRQVREFSAAESEGRAAEVAGDLLTTSRGLRRAARWLHRSQAALFRLRGPVKRDRS